MIFRVLFCFSFCSLGRCYDPTQSKDINSFYKNFEDNDRSDEKVDVFCHSGMQSLELYESINYYVENYIPIVNDTIEKKIERMEWKLKLTDAVIRQHEQRFNRNAVAVFGLPEDESEDILNTAEKAVGFFSDILQMEVSRRNIDKVSRVGRPARQYDGEIRSRPVYVKFVSFHYKKEALTKGQITRGTRFGIRAWVDEQSASDKKLLYEYLKTMCPQDRIGKIINNKIHIDGKVITIQEIREEIEARKQGLSLETFNSHKTKNGTKKVEKKKKFRDNKRLEMFYHIPY